MAGINNDLGSGGSVDMMVIDKDGNRPLRNYDRPNERALRSPRPPPSPPPSSPPRLPPSPPARAHTHAHTRRQRPPHATRPAAIEADAAWVACAGKYRKEGGYKFPRGTAKVLSKTFTPLSSLVSIETTQVPAAMQVG